MRVRFERLLEQMARTGRKAGPHLASAELGRQNVRGIEELIRARETAGDRITVCLGLVLAVSAIALPIYVIQTSDGRTNVSAILPALAGSLPVNRNFAANRPHSIDVDPVSTGAVSREGTNSQQAKQTMTEGPANKPETTPKPYRVLGVSDGVALVEGPQGVWAVMPGAALPGAGRIESIEKSGKGWVVVTSETTIAQSAF